MGYPLFVEIVYSVHFNLPQGWESRGEPAAPSGNIITMKPGLWCNILVGFPWDAGSLDQS